MKIFNYLKRILKRIFVDYNEIKQISEGNLNEISEMKFDLENKINTNNKVIESAIINNQSKLENEIISIKQQNDIIIADLEKVKNQFSYYNIELTNITRDEKHKNIIIVGFYGAPNLGDELMLETILEYLKDVPNKKITVLLANNPEYSIDKYEDIRFLHYPKTLYDFNTIAEQYDYIIFGGGAIIDDKEFENKESYKYDLGTILLKLSIRAIAFNKKVICLGLSASKEIKNIEYLRKLRYIIENSYYFSVRDEYTKKYLIEKIGEEYSEKINYISDIVLANKNILENVRRNKKEHTEQLNIGISWICNDNNTEKLNIVLNSIQEYFNKINVRCKINLIPFYEYRNIDTEYYKNILQNNYENLEISIEKYPENMKETILIFQNNDIIIGMRYHAILIAHALNIPSITVCYDIHEHYPYKIKHLNKMFKEEEALSYKNIQSSNLIEKLKLHNQPNDELKYKRSYEITLTAQRQISEVINKIFK